MIVNIETHKCKCCRLNADIWGWYGNRIAHKTQVISYQSLYYGMQGDSRGNGPWDIAPIVRLNAGGSTYTGP